MKKKVSTEETNYLVCVNKEKYSTTVLHYACRKVKKNKGKLLVLHVLKPIDHYSFGIITEKLYLERETESKETIKKLKEVTKQYTGINVEFILKEGIIENEIVKIIEEKNHIDMLIVGSEPENNSKSIILASLVSQIGKKLFIPVLIIPGDLTPDKINKLI